MHELDWRGLTVFSRAALSDADIAIGFLQEWMRSVEQDRLILLTVLNEGREKFVNVMRQECKGLAVDDVMIGYVWHWMKAREGPDPHVEREWLEIDRRDLRWKQEQTDAFMQKVAKAAESGLRLKGTEFFDGEKVTVATEDDSRLT